MEFKELIEARRSVRKYAPGEISKAAGVASKPPRKPAGEVLKMV